MTKRVNETAEEFAERRNARDRAHYDKMSGQGVKCVNEATVAAEAARLHAYCAGKVGARTADVAIGFVRVRRRA